MNFKDSYRQMNENRKPDKEFLKQLAEKMETAQYENKRKKIKNFVIPTTLTAAVAIICFLLLRPNSNVPQLPPQDFSQKADAIESITPSHTLEHEKWDEGIGNPDELMDNLQMLLQSEEIKNAYCAENNTFDKEDTLSTEELAALKESVMSAEIADINVQDNCKYYMLTFTNNNIVKFEIYDNKYLKIKGSDTFYLLPEKK